MNPDLTPLEQAFFFMIGLVFLALWIMLGIDVYKIGVKPDPDDEPDPRVNYDLLPQMLWTAVTIVVSILVIAASLGIN